MAAPTRPVTAGNLTCWAPSSSTTCAGTPTGAQLSYDIEGRLAGWQNTPTSPTSTTSNLYDGEGKRVEQQVTTSGVTTTVTYVSNIEEVSTTGSTTTTTTSYYAGRQRVAQAVNGVFSYLGSDGLGSAQTALDASGNVQASVLYGPYGSVRYSDGAMPGTYAFTGQRADATTGLSYYNARYYDSVAGQFASADSVQDGLNRYAYVGGNPESRTDPTGHRMICGADCTGGGGTPTPTCVSDASCSGGWGQQPTQPTKDSTSSCGGCKLVAIRTTDNGDARVCDQPNAQFTCSQIDAAKNAANQAAWAFGVAGGGVAILDMILSKIKEYLLKDDIVQDLEEVTNPQFDAVAAALAAAAGALVVIAGETFALGGVFGWQATMAGDSWWEDRGNLARLYGWTEVGVTAGNIVLALSTFTAAILTLTESPLTSMFFSGVTAAAIASVVGLPGLVKTAFANEYQALGMTL